MAKKTAGKARPRAATAPRRTTTKKKPAAKALAKRRGKSAAAPRRTAARPKPRRSEPGLGRPLVRAEEKLYMLFKDDYHARQIFEFLRVESVGDLEQFSPQQIIQILSAPVRKTVERIRQRLAENKRHLREDSAFAGEFLRRHPPPAAGR